MLLVTALEVEESGLRMRPSWISMARLQGLVDRPAAGPSRTGRRNGRTAALMSQVAESHRYDGEWSTP